MSDRSRAGRWKPSVNQSACPELVPFMTIAA